MGVAFAYLLGIVLLELGRGGLGSVNYYDGVCTDLRGGGSRIVPVSVCGHTFTTALRFMSGVAAWMLARIVLYYRYHRTPAVAALAAR